jgi:hypothetical protein
MGWSSLASSAIDDIGDGVSRPRLGTEGAQEPANGARPSVSRPALPL